MANERVNIFKSMKDVVFEDAFSDECGVTLIDSVEARAIAVVMGTKEQVKVTYMPAMIRIDGRERLVFNLAEISEELGRRMTPHLFETAASTHYGRMVMMDDETVVLYARTEEDMFSYVSDVETATSSRSPATFAPRYEISRRDTQSDRESVIERGAGPNDDSQSIKARASIGFRPSSETFLCWKSSIQAHIDASSSKEQILETMPHTSDEITADDFATVLKRLFSVIGNRQRYGDTTFQCLGERGVFSNAFKYELLDNFRIIESETSRFFRLLYADLFEYLESGNKLCGVWGHLESDGGKISVKSNDVQLSASSWNLAKIIE